MKVYDSILDVVGNTPMVRLSRYEKAHNLECEIYAKCEFLNPFGSVKDRIAVRMLDEAEKEGKCKPGDTLIEATSGNTGLGLALSACVKGYHCVITLPEKMSREKVCVLQLAGAQIYRTPTEAAFDSPESHISLARKLNSEIPNSIILDQYNNPENPKAHEKGTGTEIWEQLDGHVDYVVAGAGTGGTISGIATALKSKDPNVQIVGVDPHGSILAQPESLNTETGSYLVEGIGYDFIPKVLDRKVVDQWIKTGDKESFAAARDLIRLEGMLVGGSSGSALAAALQVAKTLPAGKKVVVVLPDSIRNYMSKFASDEWMEQNGFLSLPSPVLEEPWALLPVSALPLQTPITILPTLTCGEAAQIMHEVGVDQLPVIDETGKIHGVLTEGNLTAKLIAKRVNSNDEVSKVAYTRFRMISPSTTLAELTKIFQYDHFALVASSQKSYGKHGVSVERVIVTGVVTTIDLVNYVLSIHGKQNGYH
eukprot:CAMPEP_0184698082 /NCGR_PEP_ID=MMETSP0313-20130426/4823_1 /TAXON_ID=2792 /ORGANISM="Porphyridium aerugineum, Strain SAG 1380-2" /LENGTH=479 /DNA_ID=CAMNT_0027156965 /DNA_START=466 /DNA_END=1905 /DNA_ORIENTATION=-